jgi:hypothetical protein
MQIFKARLSKQIDENAFRGKWTGRSSGVGVLFRFDGTELTAVHGGTRWEPSGAPGSGGFFNVLQMAVHDVEPDCAVLDCEEVTEVNA